MGEQVLQLHLPETGTPPSYVSLVAAAIAILQTPDLDAKAALTQQVADLWLHRALRSVTSSEDASPPDHPARQPGQVEMLSPGQMPKLGKGGTLKSRQAIIHSLVHIESAAVDLAWDAIARFATDPSYSLPSSFFDDFVLVAADEARHYSLLRARLKAIGADYGDHPAHDGLWESAMATAHSLPARLAVEHCVHEARGLDMLPFTIDKFRRNGDEETATLLEQVVYPEEVTHCAAGVRWLRHLHHLAHASPPSSSSNSAAISGSSSSSPLQHGQVQMQCEAAASQVTCLAPPPAAVEVVSSAAADHLEPVTLLAALQPAADSQQPDTSSSSNSQQPRIGLPAWMVDARQYATVEDWFHALVRGNFYGLLKPPFNVSARAAAGFLPEWYEPLALRHSMTRY